MTKTKVGSFVSRKPILVFILLGIIIVFLEISSYYFISLAIGNRQNRGLFGDTFGAINSLFSGLAFTGIIITTILQKEELGYQRQELIETKLELQRSAKAQEQSAKLNALNTLLSYYISTNENHIRFHMSENSNAIKRMNEIAAEIENTLKEN